MLKTHTSNCTKVCITNIITRMIDEQLMDAGYLNVVHNWLFKLLLSQKLLFEIINL